MKEGTENGRVRKNNIVKYTHTHANKQMKRQAQTGKQARQAHRRNRKYGTPYRQQTIIQRSDILWTKKLTVS